VVRRRLALGSRDARDLQPLVRVTVPRRRQSAEGVARASLDVDLEAPDFWNASLDLIDTDAVRFEESAAELFPG